MKNKLLIFLLVLAGVIINWPSASRAMTISPLTWEVEIEPGQTEQNFINLTNENASEDLYVNGYVEVFKPKGTRGEAQVAAPAVADQAVAWVRLPQNSLKIKPQETARVPLIISVPETASAGGYYLAIMWETAASHRQNINQVRVSGRVGLLVFLQVAGSAKEELTLESFGFLSEQRIFNYLPVGFTSRLVNSCNVHLKPQGLIIIKNIFGVAEVLPFNPEKNNILPSSTREWDNVWQKKAAISGTGFWSELKREINNFAGGRYSAQLVVEYGQSRQSWESEKIFFWVWPWRLSAVAIGAVLLMVISGIFRKKKS